jgi:hypothetical protein
MSEAKCQAFQQEPRRQRRHSRAAVGNSGVVALMSNTRRWRGTRGSTKPTSDGHPRLPNGFTLTRVAPSEREGHVGFNVEL